MLPETDLYTRQFVDIIQSAATPVSNIKPSAWVERNVIMGAPFPGPYRYNKTPYCREIIDRLAPDDDARIIAVMKGLQVGVSSGVIIPGMGWINQRKPGEHLFYGRGARYYQ